MSEAKNIMQSSSSESYVHVCNIEVLDFFNPELQLINTKSVMKNKLKDILSDLKEFTVHTVLALGNKKIDYHKSTSKVFHSSAITN